MAVDGHADTAAMVSVCAAGLKRALKPQQHMPGVALCSTVIHM
jgi:hypothetical protein